MADPVWRPASEPPEGIGFVVVVVGDRIGLAWHSSWKGESRWCTHQDRRIHPTAWMHLPLPGAPGEVVRWGGDDE